MTLTLGAVSSGFGEGSQTLSGVGLPKWFRYYAVEHKVAIERTTVEMRDISQVESLPENEQVALA
ncbi:hypothetical protein BH09VER1_BH09VER1_25130 [soil metagenome]